MLNVLIVSYYFPPINSIAARRFGELAAYFPQHGCNPLILTTNSTGDLPVEIAAENIIRIGKHWQEHKKIKDKKETFVVPNRLVALKNKFFGEQFYLRSYDRSMFSWYREIKKHWPEIQDTLKHVDVIIGSYGPAADLWFSRWLSHKLKKPWIADFRDLGALLPKQRNKVVLALDEMLEKYLLSSADTLVTVSEYLANRLQTTYKKRALTIYNGWYLDPLTENGRYQPIDKRYFFYAGRFYDHRMPAVILFLQILKKYPGFSLRFRSLGPEKNEQEILAFIEKEGLKDQVEVLPPANFEQVLFEADHACCNLVFEDLSKDNSVSIGTLTGKFFELLPLHPPILSVARSDNEMGTILKETAKGKLVEGKTEIDEFFQLLLHDSNRFSGKSTAIQNYSKEQQAKKLCAEIVNIQKG